MEDKERIRTLERVLDVQITWINAADSKASPMLTLDTAMLAVLAALVPPPDKWNIQAAIFTVLASIPLLSSLLCLALAAIPRTKGPKQSLIFFGGIVSRDESQFVEAWRNISSEIYTDDLLKQSYKTGEIAAQKYAWLSWAAKAYFLSIVPWLVAVYALYRMRQ
jgi:Family of unknown function (DUF5706)